MQKKIHLWVKHESSNAFTVRKELVPMTTPKALAAAMRRRDADSMMLREMQQMLRAELEKPPETQDLDAVDELTAGICEICGLEQAVAEHSRKGLETFRKNITPQIAANTTTTTTDTIAEPVAAPVRLKRIFHWKRLAALAASFAGALMIGNFATKGALGDNLLNTGAKLLHGGVELSMTEPESAVDDLPEGLSDPYGIQEECSKAGFTAMTPQYIPEDLTNVTFDREISAGIQDVWVRIADDADERIFSLHYMHYEDESQCPDVILPTQDYSPEVREINGISVHQVIEDDYVTSTFRYNNVNYTVDCANLTAEESEAILMSFFDNTNL